jgi:D-arabinose 1-dehydrogenase-like Zn-dependent alcohol dehydrogenase
VKAAVVAAKDARWGVQEIPTPVVGPAQVLIKIAASGLCYTDVHQTHGRGSFPRVLGHEPVGEIVEIGSAVRTRRVGDRVGVPWVQAGCGRCSWCLRGEPNMCDDGIATGVNVQGGNAEYLVAYEDGTVLLPAELAYSQAAPIFCAAPTVAR